MKKPSLEEVKEYFKNALIVESSHTGWKGKINIETIRYEALAGLDFILCNCDNICGLMTLWSEKNGYSKILTYKKSKKESFVISREQIDVLCGKNEVIYELMREWFPSAFVEDKKELVLEVGKWYKCGKSIFNHQESKNSYGFRLGKWQQGNWSTKKEYFTGLISEATQEEVEEALKAEAVRRYKVGCLVKCLRNEFLNKTDVVSDQSKGKKEFYPNSNELWILVNDGLQYCCIFKSGIWATIIQPKKMTQAEIEKELGYNIEIV